MARRSALTWVDAIRLWDVSSGDLQKTLSFGTQARCGWTFVSFSPDGDMLAAGVSSGNLRAVGFNDYPGFQGACEYFGLWNLATSTQIETPREMNAIGAAFSPDGTRIATIDPDGTITAWAMPGFDVVDRFSTNWGMRRLEFSPAGSVLAFGCRDGFGLRDVRGKILLPKPRDTENKDFVSFLPDGDVLVWECTSRRTTFWRYTSEQLRLKTAPRVASQNGTVDSLAVVPNGPFFAFAGEEGGVHVNYLLTGRTNCILRGHAGPVREITLSTSGDTLASASDDRSIRLWDPASGREDGDPMEHASAVHSLCFSPDGKIMAAGCEDNTVAIWDLASRQQTTALDGHMAGVCSVAFSPMGNVLASGSNDRKVILWNLGTGQPASTLEGHTGAVLSVRFSPDGSLLASGSQDGTIKLWDVAEGARAIHDDRTPRRCQCYCLLAGRPDARFRRRTGDPDMGRCPGSRTSEPNRSYQPRPLVGLLARQHDADLRQQQRARIRLWRGR